LPLACGLLQPADENLIPVDCPHQGAAFGQRNTDEAGPAAKVDDLVARTLSGSKQDGRRHLCQASPAAGGFVIDGRVICQFVNGQQGIEHRARLAT